MRHHGFGTGGTPFSLTTRQVLGSKRGPKGFDVGGNRMIAHADDSTTEQSCGTGKIASPGSLRSPRALRISPVDPLQHVTELSGSDGDAAIGRRRPDEAAALQTLRIERHAETVMPEHLQQVAAFATKNIKVAGVRVPAQ